MYHKVHFRCNWNQWIAFLKYFMMNSNQISKETNIDGGNSLCHVGTGNKSNYCYQLEQGHQSIKEGIFLMSNIAML